MDEDRSTFFKITQLITGDDVITVDSDNDIVDIIDILLQNNTNQNGFYIVDLTKIIDKYSEWHSLLPRVKPYYAVKCNPDKNILKILRILGSGFDCASINEMLDVKNICEEDDDVDIIYANPAKSDHDLKFARTNDINLMTFDCEEDLWRIKSFHEYAELILRIKVDDSSSICKFNSKFGAKLNEVENIFNTAKVTKLNIVGVSFHVGSGCQDMTAYSKAIKDCREVIDIGKKFGFEMNVLDIGGGFPGTEPTIFKQIAEEINKSLDEYFNDVDSINVIAEPGRYFAASSHTLVLSVLKKKKTIDDKSGELVYEYTLTDGVYGSFNCNIFDHAKPKILPFNERDGTTYRCRVFGPTCDSMDTITDNCNLPDLLPGEWVYIENFGAYTSAAASNFNGFSKIPCKYILRMNS